MKRSLVRETLLSWRWEISLVTSFLFENPSVLNASLLSAHGKTPVFPTPLPFSLHQPHKRKKTGTKPIFFSLTERAMGIEPTSSAWKADIISHYTTPACFFLTLVPCHLLLVTWLAEAIPVNGSLTIRSLATPRPRRSFSIASIKAGAPTR